MVVSVRDMGNALENTYELWLERLSKVYPQKKKKKFTHKIKLYENVRVWGRDRRKNLGEGTEINLLQLHTQNGESGRG